MPKAARHRIRYPGGEGFPYDLWSYPSSDQTLRTQPLIESILHDLGDLIDAIEDVDWRDYSHVEWDQLAELGSVTSRVPSSTTIADFVVDKANSMSVAYSGAVKRRRQNRVMARIDLPASRELVELHGIISGMFRKNSATHVLEHTLQNTKSLQDLIVLLDQYSSKVVANYDAIFPCEPPDSTSLGHHLNPTTTQGVLPSTLASAPATPLPASTSNLNISTPSSRRARRASWLEDLKRRLSSS